MRHIVVDIAKIINISNNKLFAVIFTGRYDSSKISHRSVTVEQIMGNAHEPSYR
jgi:hypothetical protein